MQKANRYRYDDKKYQKFDDNDRSRKISEMKFPKKKHGKLIKFYEQNRQIYRQWFLN